MNFSKMYSIFGIIGLIAAQQIIGADRGANIIGMPILVTYSPKKPGQKPTERLRLPVDLQNSTGKDLERVLRQAANISDADGVSLLWSDAGNVDRINYNEEIGTRALKAFEQREEEKKKD